MTTLNSCLHCGSKLDWHRRQDAKFCDANCRKAYSRRGDNAKRASKNIMRDLQTIRLTIKRQPDLRTGLNDELKHLRDEINDILRLTDRETIEESFGRSELIAGYRSKRN